MPHQRVSFCFLVVLLLVITSTQAPAEEQIDQITLEEILRRLEAAEDEITSLRDELNQARDQTTSLRARLKSLDELKQLLLEPASQKPQPPTFAPEVLKEGGSAFQRSCTQCHDASRPLQKRKDLAGWRATVRRMARKRAANIPPRDFESIANYLAWVSQAQPLPEPLAGAQTAPKASTPTMPAAQIPFLGGQIELDATLSAVWRGSGRDDDALENRGFVPEFWFGGEWHSTNSPLRLRVHGCVTCHRTGPEANRVELVEATAILDLHKWLRQSDERVQVSVQAGRFVVPFGAFAQQSHPGAFRTVTKPLMFNMGQTVNRNDIGPPLLPMPYSDEGVMANLSFPLHGDLTATLDAYLVNGLQGTASGINFFQSRSYSDNNSEPAYGGRVTVGTQNVRLGSSYMAGQFNDERGSGPLDRNLDYHMFGVDLTIRHEDLIRIHAEYAMRDSDRFLFLPNKLVDDEELKGFSIEGELRILNDPRLSIVARYDTLGRNGDLPPPGSSLVHGNFNVDRVTVGFNLSLPGGSLLMVNHEHWFMPGDLDSIDVTGVRWVATFSAP